MNILGLRIGATNTSAAVSVVEDSSVQPIRFEGHEVLPTIVAHCRDRWFVGHQAKALSLHPGADVFTDFFRNTEQQFEICGDAFSPSQLVAIVVREVRRQAELQIGDAIHHCVVSKPPYFTALECQALGEAVSSEMEVLAAIAEPICAIYGAQIDEIARSAFVVRMGGRSLDIAIASRHSPWGIVQIDGDRGFGGTDLDRALADWYMDHLSPGEREHLRTDPLAQRRLFADAERAKRMLTTGNDAILGPIPIGDRGPSAPELIRRAEFENLAQGVARHLDDVVDRALEQAAAESGMRLHHIDALMFYGGSASVPLLRRTLEERTGHAFTVGPAAGLSSRGAATIGAARFRGRKGEVPQDDAEPVQVCNVTSEPITVKTGDGRQVTVFERGTRLPACTRLEVSLGESTDEVRVPTYSGESLLGDFVAQLPMVLGAETIVLIEFLMDVDECVACSVSLPGGRSTAAANLLPSGAGGNEQVAAGRWIAFTSR
jgi:molecular chaperone HscC